MSKVSFNKVSKNFGKIEVMHDITLDIQEREFTVLLGASGCGKTTLLRMLAGLETASGGDIMIDGERVNEVHPRDRNIAMVFQNYALYPTMKVFDNIGFSLEIAKKPKEEIKQKVEQVSKTLNLTECLDRLPKELSGGQRQRVAMGRAMVRDAKVFLFDEPLSNLDAKLRARMRVEIRQLHDKLGATTLYVTHDQIEAMTMADQIVLMKDGKIVQKGTPDQLYDQPNSIYVADFIGSPAMNFFHGKIEKSEEKFFFVKNNDIRFPIPNGKNIEEGKLVICGIRPPDLKIRENGGIKGHVIMEEKTGADSLLHFKNGNGAYVALVERGAASSSRTGLFEFGVDPEKVHLFDVEYQERL